MKLKSRFLSFAVLVGLTQMTLVRATQNSVPTVVESEVGGAASKWALRGSNFGIKVLEIRVVRRNDVLVIQADFENTSKNERTVLYRFRWLDADGNQVGDGESFKQVGLLGRQVQTFKGVAPHSSITDFRIEMNVEKY